MILVGIDVAKDKVDAKTISLMLATESDENAYSLQAYQNEELKSLTRYRFLNEEIKRFSTPDKILAFAGLSPTTYQNAVMEKRGSRYLRYALFLAAYLKRKLDEGKHYFVALSHVAKKLVRVIFHLKRTGESFLDFA